MTNSLSHESASGVEEPQPTVVITGAANGIGAATARRLSAHGWRVIGIDLVPAVDGSPDDEPPWIMLQGDVSDPASWEMVAEVLTRRQLNLSGLVNNAAMQLELPLS